MTPNDWYQVVNSAAVAEQFRQLAEQARVSGRLPLVLRAARWVVEELARTPTEFGESWTERPGSAVILRRGFARPLYVEYGVHQDERVVFIRRFVLVR